MEPDEAQSRIAAWYQRWWAVCLVVLLLVGGIFGTATLGGAFGGEITGSVRCANPQNGTVTGVFIEAERLPRVWGGVEIQSGFAEDWKFRQATDIVDFTYWLPFGGDYSVHFGCGSASPGEWGSDNRTPVMTGSGHFWQCSNPEHGVVTEVAADCRGN